MNRRTAPFVPLLLVLVLGCNPASQRVPDAVKAEPPEGRDRGLPQGGKGSEATKPAPRVFDESVLRGKEFLLEMGLSGPGVRDVLVGTLYRGPEAQTVEQFFADLAGGALDLAILDPDWATYLQSWARAAVEDGVSGQVRVGVPRTDGDTFVPVRVWNSSHQWTGWVVLVRAEGRWLVSDVQLASQVQDQSPFDPEAVQPISSPSLR